MTDNRIIELTADIVSAHVSNNSIATVDEWARPAIREKHWEDAIVTAISYNPRFRESKARAGHDSVFEEMLDEEDVAVRMVTRDASPLPFAVPAGCDSVDFSFGPLEVNPELGNEDELGQFIRRI